MALTRLQQVFYDNTLAFYILASSVVVLIAAGVNCDEIGSCKSYDAWAVAVAAVSTGLTFFHAIVATVKPTLADQASPFLSIFLFLWWIPGAFVLTFKAPFRFNIGNGYYASWISFFASLMFFQRTGLAAISGNKPSATEGEANTSQV